MLTRYVFLLCLSSFIAFPLLSQSWTATERLQGYQATDDAVTFIFDPLLYGVKAQKVTVTGSFRNWDQRMDDETWALMPSGNVWTLTVPNKDYGTVYLRNEFKFRINDGQWLSPPAGATNEQGGNLVFMKEAVLQTLKAEMRGPRAIWAEIAGDRPLDSKKYRLTDANGKIIPIAGVLPNTATETLITPAEDLDIRRVYFLEIPESKLKTNCSFDGWFRELHSTKELGANIHGEETTVRLFAPRAEMVKLYLYKGKNDENAYRTIEMKTDDDGVWEAFFDKSLQGVYYDFTIHGATDPGNHFYETNAVHVTDPYARVSDNTWGKARIWEATKPASPLKNGIPALEDVIAYEVHVQDFTDQLPVDESLQGTMKAMTIPGLKNSRGEKIGFDYLVDLGINTLHLLPVQEYLHHKDDDWKESFENDPYMISQGISEENYQWGYRTSHCFAVESKFRTKGKEPGAERNEFRDLVQAFHNKGIAVIIDIVPNHTAENMDGNEWYFNFNGIDKQYYYRTKDFQHIGAYGNEVKTENRPMVQRWLIDQCKHFIEEFGIDGFRIDLAGQIDEQTLIALRKEIGHDKIVYGEPWIASNDPEYEANPDWDWYKEDSPITFFQDESRNAYKGPVFELNDKKKDRGWAGGNFSERANVMLGLENSFLDDKTPLSGISYLDIHDNFALADQFGSKDFDGRLEVDQDAYKLAVTLLYTTAGPIVTHGGSEIMRSKAAAPLKEVVKTTNAGIKVYLHGKRDTYNHRFANQFLWETVGASPDGANKNDYKNMFAFWKGMNELRMSKYGQVFRQAEKLPQGYYHFISPPEESLLGYIVNNSVLVLMNAGDKPFEFKRLEIPVGNWRLVATNEAVNHQKGVKSSTLPQKLTGKRKYSIKVDKRSLAIWVKK
ncbi:MAG: alpha-amylase family glycosyl hydrolase [Calditrichia bacterium]